MLKAGDSSRGRIRHVQDMQELGTICSILRKLNTAPNRKVYELKIRYSTQ